VDTFNITIHANSHSLQRLEDRRVPPFEVILDFICTSMYNSFILALRGNRLYIIIFLFIFIPIITFADSKGLIRDQHRLRVSASSIAVSLTVLPCLIVNQTTSWENGSITERKFMTTWSLHPQPALARRKSLRHPSQSEPFSFQDSRTPKRYLTTLALNGTLCTPSSLPGGRRLLRFIERIRSAAHSRVLSLISTINLY